MTARPGPKDPAGRPPSRESRFAWRLRRLAAAAALALATVGGCDSEPDHAADPAPGVPATAGPVREPESTARTTGCRGLPSPVAHRGGTELAAENTVAAFRSAGRAGIEEWELDVRFDVQGTPVLLHDATVDRTSPMSGPIATLDAQGGAIPTDDGQYVPTLREVYDLAAEHRAHVLTELKVMPTADQWTVLVREIDATVGRSAVTIMSFDRAVVRTAQKRMPGTATGLLHGAGRLNADEVKRYGASFMQEHRSIDAGAAAEWDAAGLRLYAWTPDSTRHWARLATLPIDAVITNKPFRYRAWAAAQCRTAQVTPQDR